MGGRIWVESDAGQGQHVPLRRPPAIGEGTHQPTLRPLPFCPRRPAPNCTFCWWKTTPQTRSWLPTSCRIGVTLSRSPGTANRQSSLSQENCYNVILMDLQMPGMNGLDAAAAIRRRKNGGSRVPIITMTAHAMKGDRERCLASGMDGYLSKPMNAPEMVALVERLAAALPSGEAGTIPPSPGPKQCGPAVCRNL